MTIDTRKHAPKVEVDNRIPLRNYYRIADNLLRQASIYRDENNVIELYIILLRYLSLVSETIPYHRDYHLVNTKEKTTYKKRSYAILDELESLKPEYERKLEQQRLENTSNGSEIQSTEWRNFNKNAYLSTDIKQPAVALPRSSWRYDKGNAEGIASSSSQVDTQFNKLSISLPRPKQDTLSRHSFLGPNGLKGQWLGPRPDIKVQYPTNNDLASSENSSLEKAAQYGVVASLDGNSVEVGSTMESVLSLDDGRWLCPAEQSCPTLINDAREDPLQFVGIRQPSPPPILAKVHQEFAQIPPSKVADPRPGPAKTSQNGMPSLKSYQHLHVPVNLMVDFLRLAQKNTERNLETCAVLAGSLKNKVFHITTLIVPKQESTSDSCQTLNEEEIFEVQDRLSLFPLGWIHTHPTQTCFMSSVDLHTHYSYQIMLPEAVAIVMAPTDESSPHGIFHLSDPGGVSVIRNCQERGFHPHEEPSDGSPIYEHCSHVYMNSRMKVDVVDLR